MQRHEIPTHLGVEDKAFLGLTLRQLMTAAIGLALAYGAAGQLPLPAPLRLVTAAAVLVAAALLALWQPAGRPLEEWAFVLLQYAATARIAVWRPADAGADMDDQQPPAAVIWLPGWTASPDNVGARTGGHRRRAASPAITRRSTDA